MNTISRFQSNSAPSRDPQSKATANDQRLQVAGLNKTTSDTKILRLGGTSGPSLYPDHLRTGGAWKTSKLKDETPSLTGTGGGGSDGGGNSTPPDIVVEGPRSAPDTSTSTPPPSTSSSLSPDVVVQGQRPAPEKTSPAPAAAPSLADRIVTVAIDHPSEDELRVIAILKRRINHNDKIMPKLKDEMTLTAPLSDGSTKEVTGKEVQGLWSAMKIQIDPKGTPYPNGTGSGASTDANGVTHFAVDTLQDYMRSNYSDNENDSRADYLLFHEIAHNTQAGKAENSWECEHGQKDEKKYYPDNEKFSNSLARSIEKVIGDTPVKNPSYDYDSSFPDFSGGSPSTTSSTSADSSPAPSPSQTTPTNEDSPKAGTPDEKGPKGSFRGGPDHNQIP